MTRTELPANTGTHKLRGVAGACIVLTFQGNGRASAGFGDDESIALSEGSIFLVPDRLDLYVVPAHDTVKSLVLYRCYCPTDLNTL